MNLLHPKYLLLIGILSSFSFVPTVYKDAKDPLIGTWTTSVTMHSFEDGTIREIEPDLCFVRGNFVYYEDGSLVFNRFRTNPKTGVCEKRPADFWTGTWKRQDDDTYQINHVTKFSEEDSTEFPEQGRTYHFIDANTLMIVQDVSNWNIVDSTISEEYYLLTRVIN